MNFCDELPEANCKPGGHRKLLSRTQVKLDGREAWGDEPLSRFFQFSIKPEKCRRTVATCWRTPLPSHTPAGGGQVHPPSPPPGKLQLSGSNAHGRSAERSANSFRRQPGHRRVEQTPTQASNISVSDKQTPASPPNTIIRKFSEGLFVRVLTDGPSRLGNWDLALAQAAWYKRNPLKDPGVDKVNPRRGN